MTYESYSDPTFGRLSNLLLGFEMDLLMSKAMAIPFPAGRSKYQACNQLDILLVLIALTIEADAVYA